MTAERRQSNWCAARSLANNVLDRESEDVEAQ